MPFRAFRTCGASWQIWRQRRRRVSVPALWPLKTTTQPSTTTQRRTPQCFQPPLCPPTQTTGALQFRRRQRPRPPLRRCSARTFPASPKRLFGPLRTKTRRLRRRRQRQRPKSPTQRRRRLGFAAPLTGRAPPAPHWPPRGHPRPQRPGAVPPASKARSPPASSPLLRRWRRTQVGGPLRRCRKTPRPSLSVRLHRVGPSSPKPSEPPPRTNEAPRLGLWKRTRRDSRALAV
mmetsp:Transcript_31135/g.104795  ORF Transcript_31135/g.104795 Transcript_31135/m.104795 type:complete len:232 (-) Transcript_31135:1301-1996(-)